MNIRVLASGSTGNSVLVEMDDKKILIDAGISARRIETGLKAEGISPSELDAILITHEHQDHINGLPVFTRRFGIPVYARPATWDSIEFIDQLPAECMRLITDVIRIGRVEIESFDISHDAADPVGYIFRCQDKKAALATDLGVVTSGVVRALAFSDAIILESNHDPDMLARGSYPAFLKKRILSRVGHLSNYDAAGILGCINRKSFMQVFLAHLSQENNCPDLAEATICEQLTRRDITVGSEILIHRTYPDRTASCEF